MRYSPLQPEVIEFDVELNRVPIADNVGNDITVNWKFFDSFDPKGVFYTDSNALEMVRRQKKFMNAKMDKLNENQNVHPNHYTISGNYFPVDSAIAMKDEKKRVQVTVMNDRAQGGSADLTDSATIELMQ